MSSLRVTVWNEFLHEHQNEAARQIYPDGIHTKEIGGRFDIERVLLRIFRAL